MTYRPVTKIIDAVATAPPGPTTITSSTVIVQTPGRNLSTLFEYDGNPGATTGTMVLQGQLHPDCGIADVYEFGGSRIELDMGATVAPNYNIMAAGLMALPQMRWKITDLVTTNSRNLTAWMVE